MYLEYCFMKCLGHLLFYLCETAGGSGGGPVFYVRNNKLMLIALHRGRLDYMHFKVGTLITSVIDHVYDRPAAREYISLLNLFMMIVAIGMNYLYMYSRLQQCVDDMKS